MHLSRMELLVRSQRKDLRRRSPHYNRKRRGLGPGDGFFSKNAFHLRPARDCSRPMGMSTRTRVAATMRALLT